MRGGSAGFVAGRRGLAGFAENGESRRTNCAGGGAAPAFWGVRRTKHADPAGRFRATVRPRWSGAGTATGALTRRWCRHGTRNIVAMPPAMAPEIVAMPPATRRVVHDTGIPFRLRRVPTSVVLVNMGVYLGIRAHKSEGPVRASLCTGNESFGHPSTHANGPIDLLLLCPISHVCQ